jgi:hypothetical protein
MMRPVALEIATGDFAFAPSHRISFMAGSTLKPTPLALQRVAYPSIDEGRQ